MLYGRPCQLIYNVSLRTKNMYRKMKREWSNGWFSRHFLEGRTDLHMLNRSNLTGTRYRDETFGPTVRPYAGFRQVHGNAPLSCGKNVPVIFRGWGHWHKWLASTLSGPELHRAPLGHHGPTHSVVSKLTQDSLGVHQYPGWGLAGHRSWDNPWAYQKHAPAL